MLKTVAFTFCVFWVSVCVAYEQYAVFYAEPKFEGESYTLNSKLPDLSNMTSFVRSARSIRIRGYWRGYTAPNYDGGNLFIFNVETEFSNADRISHTDYYSMRHGGILDTSQQSMALYSSTELNGEEKIITTAASLDIDFTPMSLLSTGHSNWTFFTGSEFDGNSTCYISTQQNHYMDIMSPLLSSSRSLMRGCIDSVDSYFYANNWNSNGNKDSIKTNLQIKDK